MIMLLVVVDLVQGIGVVVLLDLSSSTGKSRSYLCSEYSVGSITISIYLCSCTYQCSYSIRSIS
jgi:inner membrane protein involved in colicin E2 resistance